MKTSEFIPDDGREHIIDDSADECWCEPWLYYETEGGGQVWIHGDNLPPPLVLIEAIAEAADADT